MSILGYHGVMSCVVLLSLVDHPSFVGVRPPLYSPAIFLCIGCGALDGHYSDVCCSLLLT